MRDRNKDDQELEKQDINLLPDDLRSVEKKARKATSAEERPYQLRSPKKRKRKRRFIWLPVFGGAHWDESAKRDSKDAATPDTKDISDVVVHHEKRPGDEHRRSLGPIPTPESAESVHVLPTAPTKLSRKRPARRGFLGLGRLFGRRGHAPALSHRISHSAPLPPKKPSTFTSEPRHYSLIKDKKEEPRTAKGTAPDVDIEVPSGGPLEPFGAKLTAIPPKDAGEEPAQSTGRPGFKLPKWLDIFSLFGKFMPKHQRVSKSSPRTHDVRKPVMPTVPQVEKKPDHGKPHGDVEQKKEEVTPGTHMPVITPVREKMPEQPKPPKKPWKLPKWLDLFSLFKGLGNRKSKKKHRKQRPHGPVPADTPPAVPTTPTVRNQPNEEYAPSQLVERKKTPVITPLPEAPKPPEPPKPPEKPKPQPPVTPPQPPPPSVEKHKAKKPHKEHKPWKLPKWLDLFSWLKKFGKRKKKDKRTASPPLKPEPLKMITPVPSAPAAREEPKLQQRPEPGEPPKPSHEPQTPYISPLVDREEESQEKPKPVAPKPVTPKPAAPEKGSLITPIPPEPMAEDQKHKRSGDKSSGQFHIPKKGFGVEIPDASVVNLIPAKYAAMRSWKQLSQLMIIAALIALGFNALVYSALGIWRGQIESQTSDVDAEILRFRDVLLVYDQKYEPQMTALGDRIEVINELLDRHIYWTNFFELLEKYTLPDVYFDGVSATTNGSLSLSAHGAGFESVTRQLYLMQSDDAQEFVTDVSITGASRGVGLGGGDEVTFAIELTLNPDLFYYAEPEA